MTTSITTMRKVVFTAAAAFLLASAVARPLGAQATAAGEGPPVVVAPVRIVDFVDRIEALGTTRADETVRITANVTEKVREIHFEDGQMVEAGQLLIELESAEERAQLDEAVAMLAERETEHQRTVDLVERGISAQSDLDRTQAMLLGARSRVTTNERPRKRSGSGA